MVMRDACFNINNSVSRSISRFDGYGLVEFKKNLWLNNKLTTPKETINGPIFLLLIYVLYMFYLK